MIKSVLVDQFNFLHVSTGNNSLLGHVLLELVVGPVLQSIVDVLPNISIFISKLLSTLIIVAHTSHYWEPDLRDPICSFSSQFSDCAR